MKQRFWTILELDRSLFRISSDFLSSSTLNITKNQVFTSTQFSSSEFTQISALLVGWLHVIGTRVFVWESIISKFGLANLLVHQTLLCAKRLKLHSHNEVPKRKVASFKMFPGFQELVVMSSITWSWYECCNELHEPCNFQFYFCPDFKCSRGGGLIGRCKNSEKKGKKRKSPSHKLNTRPMPMWSSTRNSCSCCCPQTF